MHTFENIFQFIGIKHIIKNKWNNQRSYVKSEYGARAIAKICIAWLQVAHKRRITKENEYKMRT